MFMDGAALARLIHQRGHGAATAKQKARRASRPYALFEAHFQN
jgi:hypothetical protein